MELLSAVVDFVRIIIQKNFFNLKDNTGEREELSMA